MNYNQRNPIFSLRMSDYRRSKLDKLAKFDKISANEMARKIIDKYLSNELVENKGNKEEKLLELSRYWRLIFYRSYCGVLLHT